MDQIRGIPGSSARIIGMQPFPRHPTYYEVIALGPPIELDGGYAQVELSGGPPRRVRVERIRTLGAETEYGVFNMDPQKRTI